MNIENQINESIKDSMKKKDSLRLESLRSIKSAKSRHRDCRVVKRKGRLYVINKTDARFKARQG